MHLQHIFKLQCPEINDLVGDSTTLKQYCDQIGTKALEQPDRIDPNTYLGDAFELFCEAFILSHGVESTIGISNYTPVILGEDYGVDGVGVGTNGKVATIQCKFKTNKSSLLGINDDHLSNFVSTSLIHYDVDKADTKNMLILTTAKGVSHKLNDMYRGKVRCLGYKEIASKVDNNIPFWNSFKESLAN